MPYVEEITETLIGTLDHTGGLPAHQLAGHAENLDFWMGEVSHALYVIDGYGERFKKLREGERNAAKRLGTTVHPFRSEKLLRPGISDHDLKELRRGLIDSVRQVLSRCYKEGFVSETQLDEYGGMLNLDARELRDKKGS